MTFDRALAAARATLTAHRCEGADAGREAVDLLLHAAAISRETLLLHGHDPLSPAVARRYRALVTRRLRHAPLAHLFGAASFMGREFAVTKDTLIPRPATELILEKALALATDADLVVDVGTGSGCIAVSAALALPHATTIAIDRSAPALRTARKNARTLGAHVRFMAGDLIAPASKEIATSAHALIIANLPYIPAAAYAKLSLDIRKNEPRTALVGGKDGLEPYRRLITRISALPNRPRITLACEILPAQRLPLEKLLAKTFPTATTTPITTGDGTVIGTITIISTPPSVIPAQAGIQKDRR